MSERRHDARPSLAEHGRLIGRRDAVDVVLLLLGAVVMFRVGVTGCSIS